MAKTGGLYRECPLNNVRPGQLWPGRGRGASLLPVSNSRAAGGNAMPPIAVERWYDEIEASTETLAGLVHGADLTRQVPTCPEWTLRQLATHVGRAHRWAAEITSTRSAEFIPFRQVPDGRIPDDPALHASWLRAGAAQVIAAVREAGPDPVWAFTGLRPASFWARRMAHETAVHAADAESEGLLRREGSTVTVQPGHGRGDVALRGPAGRLLLVLLRRVPPDDAQ